MILHVERLGYSRNPWRIIWDGLELPDCNYRIKRDAIAALDELLALGLPWERPDVADWHPLDRDQLRQFIHRQDGWIERHTLIAKQYEQGARL